MEKLWEHTVTDKMHSQVVLAFATIWRLAGSRDEFDKAARKSYGEDLDADTANALFLAYGCCASTSPHWASKHSKPRPPKPPRPERPTTPGTDSSSTDMTGAAALATDTDMAGADSPSTEMEGAASTHMAGAAALATRTSPDTSEAGVARCWIS